MFEDISNYLHIDVIWFFMTTVKENCYRLLDESLPEQFTKSKRLVTSIMFMAAVAQLHYNFHRKKLFGEKIGKNPFA